MVRCLNYENSIKNFEVDQVAIKKTVLILTGIFPPQFAPRMGYLSKYLGDNGWKGIAISHATTHAENTFDFLAGYIPCKKIYVSGKKSLIEKILSRFFSDATVSWELNKKMKDHITEIFSKEQIDIILCSTTRSLFPLNIAYKTAKSYGIPWIADLRDIYEQNPIKGSLQRTIKEKIGTLIRNYILRNANAITTVSKTHVKILNRYGLKAYCIYNGADRDMFIASKYHNLDKFRIVYTGTFARRKSGRDISPLFSALQQLHDNNDIDFNNCRIQFYSDAKSQKIAHDLKNSFCVPDCVDCFDLVPATEVPNVLYESSILLLLLGKGSAGVMTTKFFEYLAAGRPILCIWSDRGEVEEIINNSCAGVAAKTENDIKAFVKLKYEEWLKTGYTNADTDQNYAGEFSREHNAKQFVEVFENVLKHGDS